MMRTLYAMPLLPLAACVTDTGAAPAYICTATQECQDGDCAPSDLEFNLAKSGATGLQISVVDSSFPLAFVETTSARLPTGPVTLDTYENPQADMRLTLARNGIDIRARLILAAASDPRDISALCNANSGATQ